MEPTGIAVNKQTDVKEDPSAEDYLDSDGKPRNKAASISASDNTTASSPSTLLTSASSSPASSQGSTTSTTSTTTTYAPPTSLNPTPLPIPTAMGAANGINARLWAVVMSSGVVAFAFLLL